jgi:hypothetical protein
MGDEATASGLEQAIFGLSEVAAIRERLDRYLRSRLGTGIEDVVFRSGRIDAVWAVRTEGDRDVVIKAHRQPLDFGTLVTAARAQRLLLKASFSVPEVLSGPDQFEGLTLRG